MSESSTNIAHLTIPGIELEEPIARGGFATVYRGFQTDFNRTVAVKVLDPTSDDGATRRFRSELRAMGAVSDHPHVVPVYAAGTVDGRPYLVMPLLPAGTLADEIARGPLSSGAVIELGRSMADALSAAHAVGLLHRDVKPANILRSAYGQPQLADFGIARFVDSTMTHGDVLATVSFAAPEVLAGNPATAASDVYSLGATLYAAVAGGPPFAARGGEEPVALAVRVMSQPAPDLRERGVAPALAEVIEKAMAKKVEDRYPTAAALRDALATVSIESDPVPTTQVSTAPATTPMAPPPAPTAPPAPVARPAPARPVPARTTAPRPRDDRRWMLAALAALIVIAGISLVVLLGNRSSGPSRGAASTAATTSEGTTAPASTVAAPSADAETRTVTDYYAMLDGGRIDDGFTWLSPAYQSRAGGKASYTAFWRTIAGVQVVDVEPGASSAQVTLRYTRTDGTTSSERATMRFVADPANSGHLLIDDYKLQ